MTNLAWSILLNMLNFAIVSAMAWKILWLTRFVRHAIDAFHARWGEDYKTAILVYFGFIEDDEDDG